jgi:uncharacterized protein (TIGR02452 family)
MSSEIETLRILSCKDSDEMAASRRKELGIPTNLAAKLGRTAVEAASRGIYRNGNGEDVNWRRLIDAACEQKQSLSPESALSNRRVHEPHSTTVRVSNETTLGAARRLKRDDPKTLALNFANGISPGGGFLRGARAQEEVLCRSSALFETLVGDDMYKQHRLRALPDSTDWAIYSPDVPVFRNDDGTEIDEPWTLSFITCAAPYAPEIGQPKASLLLCRRIHRVFEIAKALGYSTLVLGAWGCGAFKNDPYRTAADFREALESHFRGIFSHAEFAISDWSADRKFLGPFRDTFLHSSKAGR